MLCLLLTLAVYCLLPSLRTQPGLNTMCTCTALLLAQLSLLVAVHAQGTISRPWCQVLGAVVHAAWLQVFCWTSICSVHMFRAFSAKTYGHGSLSSTSRRCSWQTACNIGISVLVPVFITGVVALARFVTTNGRNVGYSAVSCYLESTVLVGVSMVLPASLLQLFNLTLFVLTVRRIHEVMRLNPRSEDQQESQRHVHVCARLSLLTGITWLIAFVAEGLNVDWLQFVSILANGGQGVMILLSYAATRRIVAMVAVKVGWEPRERSSSSQSTNSTFQSRNA
ncbi:G-protein coupled receptor Mth2-like [Littorina saxatilis]|uniref:G-protein coupled receptor Mth2-like n=1 Tax=Littorina saxatilis TaxID=31220 RepID=UPI0038B513E3